MSLFAVVALFADFTTEQLVASAMVGVGGVVLYNGVVFLRQSRKQRAELNRPTTDLDDYAPDSAKKGDPKEEESATSPRAGVAMLVIGIVMLIGGMIWRIDAER